MQRKTIAERLAILDTRSQYSSRRALAIANNVTEGTIRGWEKCEEKYRAQVQFNGRARSTSRGSAARQVITSVEIPVLLDFIKDAREQNERNAVVYCNFQAFLFRI
jgi:hypothetical protein